MNQFYPSNLYYGFRIKYAVRKFLKFTNTFVLLGAIFGAMWIGQMIVALAHLPVVVNILR